MELDRWGLDPPAYALTMTLPGVQLRCAVAGTGTMPKLARFVATGPHHAGTTEFRIGTLFGAPLRLIKDEEFAGRFFIRAAAADGLVDVNLAGEVAGGFATAMKELAVDLGGRGG